MGDFRRRAAVLWAEVPAGSKPFVVLTLLATALRFVALDSSPPGFYLDEAAISAQVICVRQSGHDLSGATWPLFSQVLGGGYATPGYLYTGAVWTWLFGDSIASFRAMAAFFGAMTVVGVYFLALVLWSRRELAWLCAACAALSPWGFMFSRIAWDPPLAPCCWIGSLYFLFAARSGKPWRVVVAGLLGALACYSYPPLRLQFVLSVPVIAAFIFSYRRELGRALWAYLSVAAVAMVPLIQLTVSGELQGRFKALSIWSDQHLAQFGGFSFPLVLEIFVENMALHLSPSYLLFSGDANLRHSTQAVGQWSWLEISAIFGAIVFALYARARRARVMRSRRALCTVWLLVWLYLAGVVPAAFTWESNPHALRSIGAQPFVALLAGWGIQSLSDQLKAARLVFACIASAFAVFYGYDYFAHFPERSGAWFDASVIAHAEKQESVARGPLLPLLREISGGYPDLAAAYFDLRSGRRTCR